MFRTTCSLLGKIVRSDGFGGVGQDMAHKYGGPWSEIKLDAVEYYLQCYAKALTWAKMDLWYIDAFAGSGDREAERQVGGIFEGREMETVIETLDGSARRGLKIEPPFKHFIFIEKDPERAAALESVRVDWPNAEIQVLRGDANDELLEIIGKAPWTSKSRSRSRGVVFLDPFSMQVDWSTLEALSQTECLDIWFLFNVAAVTRQLAHDYAGIGNKESMLDRVLSPRWRELYAMQPENPSGQTDIFAGLFDAPPKQSTVRRIVSKKQIDQWFEGLLRETFAFVSESLPIMTPHSGHTFSLFLAVANPDPKATELAEKFVRYVNRKYAPKPQASRRRSGR